MQERESIHVCYRVRLSSNNHFLPPYQPTLKRDFLINYNSQVQCNYRRGYHIGINA